MIFDAKVSRNEKLTSDCFLLGLEKPADFSAKSGQFLQVKLNFDYPLLRRPLSIFDITETEIILLIKEVGLLTKQFRSLKQGDIINILGPLGNTFPIKEDKRSILLVGGGIGTAPIGFLAKELNDNKISFESFLGFRDGSYGLEPFQTMPLTIHDESLTPGFITEELTERIQKDSDIIVYACGPTPLLKAVIRLSQKYSFEAYLSLEERMACGVGACVGCSVKIARGVDFVYKKVCKDGPVFLASEVLYE